MEKPELKTECFNAQNLEQYLVKKASNHNCYKTYTTAERIQDWAREDCIYLSDGTNWNDKFDRKTFNQESDDIKRFGRCFSFSASESVAMWMLYCGMEKKGAMLEFTKSAMRTLISKTDSVKLGYWDNESFVTVVELQRGQYTLNLKDILYRGKQNQESKHIYIRRSDESFKEAPADVIQQLTHCVKTISWSYENETRLMLSVKKSLLPSGTNITDAQIHLHGALNGINSGQGISAICAPNFLGEKPFKPSALSEEIDWNLCAKCTGAKR